MNNDYEYDQGIILYTDGNYMFYQWYTGFEDKINILGELASDYKILDVIYDPTGEQYAYICSQSS